MTSALSLRRRLVNGLMLSLSGLCTFLTLGVLFFILGYIVYHGIGALDWAFFTKLPKPVGEEGGGMANAILGTIKLLTVASLIGVPVGVLGGVYLSEYGRKNLIGFLIRYAADLLNGIPSIVMGIFAYTMVVLPMGHFSTLAGGVALGIMMIPIAVRTTEEFLKLVPASIREAALALGMHQWKAISFIVIPSAFRGIVTGIMLDLARVAGETAPLLFTAFNNRFWTRGWFEPTASLPVMIYTYAISPYEDWHRQAWAAGIVLLALVLAANLFSRAILHRQLKG